MQNHFVTFIEVANFLLLKPLSLLLNQFQIFFFHIFQWFWQMNFLDIQSWWEIPCIAHFCSLFRSPFKLPEFDIEVWYNFRNRNVFNLWNKKNWKQDLEEALLADGTTGDVPLLSELIVSLLRGCDIVRYETITTSNYQMFLRRVLRKKCNVWHEIELIFSYI